MTPEQKARQKIDEQLDHCGWQVQSQRQMNISAGLGVAVREFPLKTGFADYMLYADAKLIRVIEAKAEDHRLSEVDDAYLLAFMKRYNGRFLFLSEDELRLWWPSWLESQPPPGLELVEKSKGAVVYERKEP